MKNICIGHGAGSHLTSENYKLCLKTPYIDIVEDITDREYNLIQRVLDTVMYYYHNNDVVSSVQRTVTGEEVYNIGHKAGCMKEQLPIINNTNF